MVTSGSEYSNTVIIAPLIPWGCVCAYPGQQVPGLQERCGPGRYPEAPAAGEDTITAG